MQLQFPVTAAHNNEFTTTSQTFAAAAASFSNPSRPRERIWEHSYHLLKIYSKMHGHCKVPLNYDKKLNAWVRQQRTYYKKKKLKREKIEKLEKIGFEWQVDDKWDYYFSLLLEHRQQTNSCKMRQIFTVKDNSGKKVNLGAWVHRQKFQCWDPRKVELLKSIGFLLKLYLLIYSCRLLVI